MVRLAVASNRGAPGRAFHLALDPGLLVGILDVHELDADRAAIGLAQDGLDFPQRRGLAAEHVVDEDRLVEIVVGETVGARVQLGVRAGNLQAERIEPRLQMAAHAIGADQHQRAQRGDGGGAHLLAGERRGRRLPRWPGDRGAHLLLEFRMAGAQEAPVASSSTARASSFSAPNSSAKVGSTECGLAAQRAYCSPRNAAFAPLKAEARMSTPAIARGPLICAGAT